MGTIYTRGRTWALGPEGDTCDYDFVENEEFREGIILEPWCGVTATPRKPIPS